MIEALAILAVFLASALIYIGARLQAQNVRLDPAEELAQLKESLAWAEGRLQEATARRWDEDMIGRIAEQRAEILDKLARFQASRQS